MAASPLALRLSMIYLTTFWMQRHGRIFASSFRLQQYRLLPARRIRALTRLFADSAGSISLTTTRQQEDSLIKEQEGDASIKVPVKFVPFPFQYRQEIEVDIQSLTNQGLGVGRISLASNEHQETDQLTADNGAAMPDKEVTNSSASDVSMSRPWVVMVPNVVPGERVLARVFRNYPSYSEADFVRIIGEPSPDRILQPPCPLSEECGGCQYQHISIDRQRTIKTEHTLEAFQQYGLLLDDMDTNGSILQHCTGTAETFQYRSKLTPHYDAPRNQSPPIIGFQRQMSRQVIDVDSCCIATPPVNAKYQKVRHDLLISLAQQQRKEQDETSEDANFTSKRKKRRKANGATLLFRQDNLDSETISTTHSDVIRTTVLGIHFDYQAGNFFQNNYYVLPLMVDLVLKQATKPLPHENNASPTHLIDCYCGSGLFAISCAARAQPAFTKVIGIEINAKAIDEATRNAALNGLTTDQVSFVAASAENIFAPVSRSNTDYDLTKNDAGTATSSSDFPPDETVVVIDPPRKGCSPQFLDLLLEFKPARVVYVSCNVVTQGRDAKVLVDAGYECTYIQPLDLFPQTRHVECVATFERR
ncbi:hypothetical protein MPSEU_000034100 [Mayamaea pseudoterrestris]|nr:hypothetical protein MPSEU_000034100 [Mayamaea pseudoterrestris]